MSLATLPAIFKPLKPVLMRAEELDKDTAGEDSKVVAYYCRQYAMERGLELRQQQDASASSGANDFLMALMTRLEADKSSLPAPVNKETGKATCASFADRVFAKAYQEDVSGFADKNTARTFYAAGIFYEILHQFGEFDQAEVKRRQYSKWKSADIVKALKEGRPIEPGGPDGLGPEEGGGLPLPDSGSGLGSPETGRTTEAADGGLPVIAPWDAIGVGGASGGGSAASAASGAGGGSGVGGGALPPQSGGLPPVVPMGTAPPSASPAAGGFGGPGAPPPYSPPGYVAPVAPTEAPLAAPSDAAASFVPTPGSYAQGSLHTNELKIADAVEFAKYGIRFLENRDVDGGLQYLEQAVAQLRAARS
mmetsp:Transcript_11515/g.27097  ORF Transcript_11515/g.27097 Transcript_11515/m.27097 type:complete len:364 (+) Transcript_11515:84-1175(+)